MDFDPQDRGVRFPTEDRELELDKKPLMVSKLKFKLKVVHGDKHQKDNDHGAVRSNGSDWICKLCGKEFGSVKALGGHMRVHQEQARSAGVAGDRGGCLSRKGHNLWLLVNDGKLTCSLCGKTFPSSKSLFGHMRCHPEREWRGMHPPESSKPATNSGVAMTASTATLPSEDQALMAVDDHRVNYEHYDDDDHHHQIGCVDLLRGLPRWSVKARRCCINAATMEDYDEDRMVKGAVYGLMLMATGNDRYRNLDDGDEIGDEDNPSNKLQVSSSNDKPRFDDGRTSDQEQNCADSADNIKLLLEGLEEEENSRSDVAAELNPTDPVCIKGDTLGKKRKRQTAKVKDSEPSNHQISNPDAAAAASKYYRCSICGKEFATHQALGGHKSSAHYKVLSKNMAHQEQELVEQYGGLGEVKTPQFDGQEGIHPIASMSQLPLPPSAPATPMAVSEAGTSTSHICKTCDKEFPSGQALGGHMRRHLSGPPSSSLLTSLPGQVELFMMSSDGHDHSGSSSAAADDTMQVLGFDLNQLPGDDDPNA